MPKRLAWFILLTAFAVTRFGTWALPTALGNSSSPTIAFYSTSGSNNVSYRTWNGSSWSSASTTASVGGQPYWVVARNCPKREETVVVTLDGVDDVNVMFYASGSWSAVTEVCTNAGQKDERAIDAAYEQSSGDCMIVYYDSGETNLGYRTYSGSTLSSETDISRPGSSTVNYIALFSRPNSDQIMLLAADQNNDLFANSWSGTAWSGWSTIDTGLQTIIEECFSFAYESQSGEGLIFYFESPHKQPRYRTWSGSAWSSESSLSNIGGNGRFVRMASDTVSDEILVGVLDDEYDLNLLKWNGSSFGSYDEVTTSTPDIDIRNFDLAYEVGGGEALVVYSESGQNQLRYRSWNGSSWSSEQNGPDIGQPARAVQLIRGAISSANEVMIGASDTDDDLSLLRWNGSTVGLLSAASTSIGVDPKSIQFMISVPAALALVPANIPYAIDFQGTVGAEWSDSTVSSNATYGTFLGRYHNSSVNLALNTTVGATYTLTFDLYAIDSWDGNSSTGGPDYFQVSVGGSQVFSKTFTHDPGWIADGCTYPHPADQYGSYGYSSSWTDGLYRTVEIVFTATGSVSTLTFGASLTDESSLGLNDESWGIDNVSVKAATFVDVSSTAGFNVQTTTSEQDGSGFHWADLDADGDLDAIVTGGSTSRLMLNNLAAGTFTVSSFGGGAVREQGALADYDNDGDFDFWSTEVSSDGTQRLFTNNGSAGFTNAGVSGFTGSATNEGCGAVDADSDGWMDLLVFSDNGNWLGLNQKSSTVAFSATNASSYGLNGSANYGARGYCSSGDINNDGYLDFFYRYNNGRLFVSDGDGTYTQNARSISVLTGGYEDTASALADYDNDRDLDLFVPRTTAGYTGSLWRNDVNWTAGTGNFTDVSTSAGLTLNNKPAYSGNTGTRSGCWGDYDNDGDLDLFIVGANGNCLLYKNNGSGTFTRTGEGISVTGSGLDGVFVDYDNDGDLDLAVTRDSSTAMLFKNQTNNSNYLKVRLIGTGSGGTNKSAQGIRIEVWNGAGTTFIARRDVGTARGYGGAEPFWAHFGGLAPNTSYKLKVYFDSLPATTPYEVSVMPSAVSTTIGTTVIPQMLTITEPATNKKVMIWSEVRN